MPQWRTTSSCLIPFRCYGRERVGYMEHGRYAAPGRNWTCTTNPVREDRPAWFHTHRCTHTHTHREKRKPQSAVWQAAVPECSTRVEESLPQGMSDMANEAVVARTSRAGSIAVWACFSMFERVRTCCATMWPILEYNKLRYTLPQGFLIPLSLLTALEIDKPLLLCTWSSLSGDGLAKTCVSTTRGN